jgi:hypothetical protein
MAPETRPSGVIYHVMHRRPQVARILDNIGISPRRRPSLLIFEIFSSFTIMAGAEPMIYLVQVLALASWSRLV